MSDYTPPTDDVRNHYAYGCGPEHTWAESREDFDRWLAAHDAEKRAEWEAEQSRADAVGSMSVYDDGYTAGVAEGRAVALAEQGEVEWEYGLADEGAVEPYSDYSTDLDWLLDGLHPLDRGTIILRRRKAGPWVPVDENGSER